MYAEGIVPKHIITAQTMGFPFRASQAAQPHKHPRVVPMARMINVFIELPMDTSVIKTNCNAAHTIIATRLADYLLRLHGKSKAPIPTSSIQGVPVIPRSDKSRPHHKKDGDSNLYCIQEVF